MQTALFNNPSVQPVAWTAPTAAATHIQQFRRGEIILLDSAPTHRPYHLLAGEVVIVRHGRPVDLIEPGEWLAGWGGTDAIAVAWSDSVLTTSG